jgi:hypothetical protein
MDLRQLKFWPDTPSARCRCCNRKLTDPASIELGIGPVCRKKAVAVDEPRHAQRKNIFLAGGCLPVGVMWSHTMIS